MTNLREYYLYSELDTKTLCQLQPFIHAYRPHDDIPSCKAEGMDRVDQEETTWEYIKRQHCGSSNRSWMHLTCDIPIIHTEADVGATKGKSKPQEDVGATHTLWGRICSIFT